MTDLTAVRAEIQRQRKDFRGVPELWCNIAEAAAEVLRKVWRGQCSCCHEGGCSDGCGCDDTTAKDSALDKLDAALRALPEGAR